MDEGARSVSINNKFLKKLTKKNGIMESVQTETRTVKYKEGDVVLLKDGREGTILHELKTDHGDMVYLVEIDGLDCESWPYVWEPRHIRTFPEKTDYTTEAGIEKVISPS
jgi:hypothetical protein